MRTSNTVVWLSILIVVLTLVATGVGLFYQDGGSEYGFTSIRGETTQMYGQGLYRYDSSLVGTGFQVQDTVTLVLGVPLLVLSILLYRRGYLRGGLLLAGTLIYFLYNYSSMALGAAYNNLFLVYVAILSASLYGLVTALTCFDLTALPSHFAGSLPRRATSIFLIVSGVVLVALWALTSILPGLLSGNTPMLGGYTTGVTWVVDMGVLGPGLMAGGILLRRHAPAGYLLASVLLIFSVVLGVQLTAMGIVQFAAGLFGIGQFVGMVVSFSILTLFAIWFTIVLFRNFSDATTYEPGTLSKTARGAHA
jgi:hypothetical protein